MTPRPLAASWSDAARFAGDGAAAGCTALPASFVGIAAVLGAMHGWPTPQFWWLLAGSGPAGAVVGAAAGVVGAAAAAIAERWGPALTLAVGPLLGGIATVGVWGYLAVVTDSPLVPRSWIHWRDLGLLATAAVAVVAPGWVTYVLARWRDRPIWVWIGGVAGWCGGVGAAVAAAVAALDP